jgi:hypothetical protein
MIRYTYLLVIYCFLSIQVLGQVVFTKEKEKFAKEWQRAVSDPDAQEFCKEVLPKLLKSDKMTEGTFQKIADNCNTLQEKKMSVYPEVFMYLKCAVYQIENKFPSVFCNDWYSIMVGIHAKNNSKFEEFMQFSYNLYRYRALYKEDGYRWFFEKGNMAWASLSDKKLNIVCTDGNFICRVYDGPKTVTDSIVIYRTAGTFDVYANKWEGRNGTITWEKVKFDREKTFARIRGYKCDLKTAMVKVDTVELTTPYFTNPIMGKLADKTILERNEGESSPQFNSFEKRLKIPNLRDNLDYDGGFTLEGAEFIGKGTVEKPAKIILKQQNNPLFEIAAVDFQMDPTKIISRKASLKMFYPGGDSLHINEGFLYLDENKKELNFTAAKKGFEKVPFEDSYFKVYVQAPMLAHKLNTPLVWYTYEVGTSQEQKVVDIVSQDFFDPALYQKFKGIGSVHPFTAIAKKCKAEGKQEYSEADLATLLNKTIQQAKPELMDMAAAGFLTYSAVKANIIRVENKLMTYALAGSGERDYDYLRLRSDLRPIKSPYTQQEIQNDRNLQFEDEKLRTISARREKVIAFATINLDRKELRVNEVEEITISPVQKTSIFPDSSFIRMEKNRDFNFTGWLVAGKLEVHSDYAKFEYENFKVNIPSSDYAFLRVKPLKPEDGQESIPMQSNISFLKGEVFIDSKDSRNGKMVKNAHYPILNSTEITKVFYNDNSILKGAYDSLRFYYALEPFTLDSLDNFNEKALVFEGELNSGGIFPKIKEGLKIMNDYSFGFSTKSPEGGYPFYGSDTKYDNKIILSNNGLQGQGTINFLNSTAESNKLTFLPDSTIGIAKFVNKEINEGVKYPDVKSESAYICYIPGKQLMKASSYREVPLTMFNGEANLSGNLFIDKTGAKGKGSLRFKDAAMRSENYSFSNDEINSNSTSFSLLNRYAKFGEDPIAIQAEDFQASISFKTRIGKFTSEIAKPTTYPANKYYCRWDGFVWQIDDGSLEFEKRKKGESSFEASIDLTKDNCYCTDEKQDSLRFKSMKAFYDLKQQTLFCQKVDFVQVGDAHLFPDSNKVNIRIAGVMDPLINAKIIASFINKYHTFTNANVQVKSRKVYEGNAKYNYYDRDSVLTIIQLSSIRSNVRATLGIGEVTESANFKLSKEFDYYGKISVLTTLSGIILDGQARLNHTCNYEKSWMSFKDTIVANNIQIPISVNPVNAKGEKLANGFLWRDSDKSDSLRIYPSFLSKKDGQLDEFLHTSSGYIQFNQKASEFQIGSKKRLNKDDTLSNLLSLHTTTCIVTGLGDISLGLNLGEIKADLYGKIQYRPIDSKTSINCNLKMDLPVEKSLFESLANKIRSTEEFPEIDIKNMKYDLRNTLTHWVGKNKMEDVFKEFDEEKLRKLPSSLENSIILTGVVFEFFDNSKNSTAKVEKGLITRNNKVGLLGMNGIALAREIDFQLFFNQKCSKESGQGFSMIFNLPNDRFYFLNYTMDKKDGSLLLQTPDAAFSKIITDIKPDKRKSKNFSYDIADPTLADNLIAKFKGYFLYR